jgi:N-acetyl-anhydromuramyl-L-alanine amidase AmpD
MAKIGYHFVVLGDGTIAMGRMLSEIGAHAKGHNLKSIGICVVGDNTQKEHWWTDEQIVCLRALVQVLQILCPQTEILGHRDLPGAATECPGLNVLALLEKENESWTVARLRASSVP